MPSVALMLLLRVGQVLNFAGLVRSKNAASSAMRLLLDLAIVLLGLWAIGIGFLPRDAQRVFDLTNLVSDDERLIDFLVNNVLPFILVVTGCVSGAILERTRIAPVLVFSVLSAIALPLLMQLAHRMGFAGSWLAMATMFGGMAALVAGKIAGPRKGKYNRDLSVNFIPGHGIIYQIVGVLLFFIGMMSITRGGMGMLLATSAAILSSAISGKLQFGKIDTCLTLAGLVGGACAASAGIEHGWVAVITGAAAGVLVPWILIKIEVMFRIDDVAGSAATHLVGGLLGTIAVILQAQLGSHDENYSLLGNLLYVLIVLGAGAAFAFAVFNTFARLGKLRVSESAEFDGTDLSELDLNAYPDFQQTMIKSYHLREL